MAQEDEVLSCIKGKVEKLISSHQKLLLENQQLIEEKKNLQKDVETQKQEIKKLDEINKFIKFAKSIAKNDDDTNNVKSKINELVRDIDKCVELLKS